MSVQKRAANQRIDPYGNYRFRVEIDGLEQANFCEASIPESSSQIIEHRQGTDPLHLRKQSGLLSYGNLVLKMGLTASMELYNWRRLVEQGNLSVARKNVAVILVDEEYNEAARWHFTNAWPSKYVGPELNAKGNDVAIETLELAFESMERVK